MHAVRWIVNVDAYLVKYLRHSRITRHPSEYIKYQIWRRGINLMSKVVSYECHALHLDRKSLAINLVIFGVDS